MKNKVLIELIVPDIYETYNIYIPVNKRIGNIIVLLNKSINELSDGAYVGSDKTKIYNSDTGTSYPITALVRNTDIRNGTKLVLI